MNFEEALKLADAAVFAKTNKHLRDIEIMVLSGAWEGNKYREIAKDSGYTPEYLMQDVGSNLWKLLSEALGEEVSCRVRRHQPFQRAIDHLLATHQSCRVVGCVATNRSKERSTIY